MLYEKWIGSISKYTNNTYQGHDTITYANFVPLTLANALEFEYLGPQGMRCLIAWALFRRLVMITDPDRRTTNGDPETSCYKNTTSVMGLALTSRFLYSVISNKTIVEADEMTTNIRKAYQAAMQSSSWMTGCVRNTAVRKLGNIRQHIGGLGNFQDGAYVEKYYDFLLSWLLLVLLLPLLPPDWLLPPFFISSRGGKEADLSLDRLELYPRLADRRRVLERWLLDFSFFYE
ncbi:hypothetical protein HPB49_000724 [Dermacentor silvarum]|uniref:Uncharacterized protein n=1 Tax=Dermacentor silvarum TaxID=543639 RepID=A0ACB8D1R7_DERSI|nr:hypothetical protein HPB49_000724 [Dermacentor silvarum]